MGLNLTMDMNWGCLILLSLSKKGPKTLSRTQWCQTLVIQPVHHGSSRILLVHFLGHPEDLHCFLKNDTKLHNFIKIALFSVKYQLGLGYKHPPFKALRK